MLVGRVRAVVDEWKEGKYVESFPIRRVCQLRQGGADVTKSHS
jgi:hypothetical protein